MPRCNCDHSLDLADRLRFVATVIPKAIRLLHSGKRAKAVALLQACATIAIELDRLSVAS